MSVWFFEVWRRPRFEYASSLGPYEAVAKLNEGFVQRHRTAEFVNLVLRGNPGNDTFAGWASGLAFEVYRTNPGMRESWRRTLSGRSVVAQDGCILTGRFAYPLFTRVFLAIWLMVSGVGATTAVVSGAILFSVGPRNSVGMLLGVAGFMIGMFAFGLLLAGVSLGRGREDEARVREWVERELPAADPQHRVNG